MSPRKQLMAYEEEKLEYGLGDMEALKWSDEYDVVKSTDCWRRNIRRSVALTLVSLLACAALFGAVQCDHEQAIRAIDELIPASLALYRHHYPSVEQVFSFEKTMTTTTQAEPTSTLAQQEEEERFLTYLPHSGFNNQRIALLNALTLAHLTNRTLVLPPARLGQPEPWYPSHILQAKLEKPTFSPVTGDRLYELVEWSWFFGDDFFDKIAGVRVLEREDMSRTWLDNRLGISHPSSSPQERGLARREQVRTFSDRERRSYQIYDDAQAHTRHPKQAEKRFARRINLDDLTQATETLLEFGSLFSSSRLVLTRPENIEWRKTIEGEMVFRNEHLDKLSDAIVQELGRDFIGMHLRVGDGPFERKALDNVEKVLESVQDRVLASPAMPSSAEGGSQQLSLAGRSGTPRPRSEHRAHQKRATEAATTPIQAAWSTDDHSESASSVPLSPVVRPRIAKRDRGARLECRRPLHTDPSKLLLNTPVYIATDAVSPRTHEALQHVFETFPCAFTLADFDKVIKSTLEADERMQDSLDSVFVRPFLEAEVVAKASWAVGTPGSTFSAFATGPLHRHYASQRRR